MIVWDLADGSARQRRWKSRVGGGYLRRVPPIRGPMMPGRRPRYQFVPGLGRTAGPIHGDTAVRPFHKRSWPVGRMTRPVAVRHQRA